jgi:hypothetical protein
MICTLIQCDPYVAEMRIWAQSWCETAARAGFLSTLIESLSTISIAAPVSKNGVKLLSQILCRLGFVDDDHRYHFDVLSSGGSLQGSIQRTIDNLGKKEWAVHGVYAISAILAGEFLV